MQPSYIVETLTAGNVRDYSAYGLVELDFRVTGGTMGTITIYRDLVDGTVQITNFYDQNNGGPYTTITAATPPVESPAAR
jgi:hypothetical protein